MKPWTIWISTTSEIALWTHFLELPQVFKAILALLVAKGRASRFTTPSKILCTSSGTKQPEKTYSCTSKVIKRLKM